MKPVLIQSLPVSLELWIPKLGDWILFSEHNASPVNDDFGSSDSFFSDPIYI